MARMGANLKHTLPQLLKDKGWTQAELATATGIKRTDINAICTGRIQVGQKRLQRIAAALEVNVSELDTTVTTPNGFAWSLLLQIVRELRRAAEHEQPDRLREFAAELHGLADDFEAVAAARSLAEPV